MVYRFFHVTYDIVTPESAENGDAAEIGYAKPHGWRFPLNTMSDDDVKACAMTLREARDIAWPIFDCDRWFSGESHTLNYQTGEDITYAVHPPENITPSSYERVKRALGVRF